MTPPNISPHHLQVAYVIWKLQGATAAIRYALRHTPGGTLVWQRHRNTPVPVSQEWVVGLRNGVIEFVDDAAINKEFEPADNTDIKAVLGFTKDEQL